MTTRNTPRAKMNDRDLMTLKMELAAAYERGERGMLARLSASHPRYAQELAQFSAALVATSVTAPDAITPESEQLAQRAKARAFAAVFGASAAPVAVAAPAAVASVAPAATASVLGRVASLKALRQARGLSVRAAATRLQLGMDVLNALESGRIAARTIPERLVAALSALLDATAEQVQGLVQAQPAVRPAFQRSRTGEGKTQSEPQELDFESAVRLSPEMSAEEKAYWLGE